MVVSSQRGFTVIELMLFLGVSGALFAALMFGVNGTINQQRYRESVTSFSTLLQNQYSEVSNTRNDANVLELNSGSNNFSCSSTGGVKKDPGNTAYRRGTSQCVLLGKALQIKNGTEIDIYHVVGYDPARDTSQDANNPGSSDQCTLSKLAVGQNLGDLDAIRQFNPKVTTDFDFDSESLEWDSKLVTTDEKHDPVTAGILILRSPQSGLLRVFTAEGTLPSNLCDMITTSASTCPLQMNVESDSALTAAQESVSINPNVSGPDGVVVNQPLGQACTT